MLFERILRLDDLAVHKGFAIEPDEIGKEGVSKLTKSE